MAATREVKFAPAAAGVESPKADPATFTYYHVSLSCKQQPTAEYCRVHLGLLGYECLRDLHWNGERVDAWLHGTPVNMDKVMRYVVNLEQHKMLPGSSGAMTPVSADPPWAQVCMGKPGDDLVGMMLRWAMFQTEHQKRASVSTVCFWPHHSMRHHILQGSAYHQWRAKAILWLAPLLLILLALDTQIPNASTTFRLLLLAMMPLLGVAYWYHMLIAREASVRGL
jgi:hypothetical protein